MEELEAKAPLSESDVKVPAPYIEEAGVQYPSLYESGIAGKAGLSDVRVRSCSWNWLTVCFQLPFLLRDGKSETVLFPLVYESATAMEGLKLYFLLLFLILIPEIERLELFELEVLPGEDKEFFGLSECDSECDRAKPGV